MGNNIFGSQFSPFYGFDYAAYMEAIEKLAMKPVTTAAATTIMYVIRLDGGTGRQHLGRYTKQDGYGGFGTDKPLHEASRYASPLEAAKAIEARNSKNPANELYAIIPVKVIEKPGQDIIEAVPGKTTFVLRVASGYRDGYYVYFQGTAPSTDGSASYTPGETSAYAFPTAQAATDWLAKRVTGAFANSSGPLTVEKVFVPGTKKVIGKTPATTTVELL